MNWTVVFQQVLLAVGGVLGTAIGVFAVLAVKRIAAKIGLSVETSELYLVHDAVRKGVAAAEKWAKKGKKKNTGSEKLDYALKIIKGILSNKVVKKYTDEKLTHLVEGTLARDEQRPG